MKVQAQSLSLVQAACFDVLARGDFTGEEP